MRNSVREQNTLNVGIICDCSIRTWMRKKSKLCAKLSGVLRFKRAGAGDESTDTAKGGERRAPAWNRLREFGAQRPLKHIPESKKVCGSAVKHRKKGIGPWLALVEKTQNHCASILFPSSSSGDFTLERGEPAGWEKPRPHTGDIMRACSACHPRVEALMPQENTSQRPQRLTDDGAPSLGIF